MKNALVKLAISSENWLHILVNGKSTSYDLAKFSFNINKPFDKKHNHLLETNLIEQVKSFVKSNTKHFWIFSQPLFYKTAISRINGRSELDHILVFIDNLGANIIEVTILNQPVKSFFNDREIDDKIIARKDCNIHKNETEYFS
jgi:hypothetical protein